MATIRRCGSVIFFIVDYGIIAPGFSGDWNEAAPKAEPNFITKSELMIILKSDFLSFIVETERQHHPPSQSEVRAAGMVGFMRSLNVDSLEILFFTGNYT